MGEDAVLGALFDEEVGLRCGEALCERVAAMPRAFFWPDRRSSKPTETRLKLLPQLLHTHGALIRSGQIAVRGGSFTAEFDRDVRDHDAMFGPEFLNLPLTLVQEPVEAMDEQHTFAWVLGCSAATDQYIISTLGRGEALSQEPFGNYLEARKFPGLKRRYVHRVDATRRTTLANRNRLRKLTILTWGNVWPVREPNSRFGQFNSLPSYSLVVHRNDWGTDFPGATRSRGFVAFTAGAESGILREPLTRPS